MTQPVPPEILALINGLSTTSGRRLIAVAGPPASGKSTLAEQLADILPDAAVVPMDGFHLDNEVLSERGLLGRKGAPQTFDALGFLDLVKALRAPVTLSYPTFDRLRDCVVPDGGEVKADCKTVIVEGNYLLLDSAPWDQLHKLWDASIFLDVSPDVLRDRLLQRWRDHGYSEAQALTKAESNDLPNAQVVMQSAVNATYIVNDA
ncbi:AAA domain-containing protein [Litoreibacter ascidiaceicola]|uniref:AAA domain-containing protein n=1 Tax=Litoreibacter ascidiaceicola TaxID=1486859 RepID=A0A1M4ZYF1_9RHOB|nr:AAA family ATPase [Litoreibacter ascidiaceicola]SHF22887.1 AAA domain-containing protein [Litoreibacter ascidiaceicola]